MKIKSVVIYRRGVSYKVGYTYDGRKLHRIEKDDSGYTGYTECSNLVFKAPNNYVIEYLEND